jgi:hypothetical protein
MVSEGRNGRFHSHRVVTRAFAPTDCLGSGDARHLICPPLDLPIGRSRHSTGWRIRCKSVLLPIRSLYGRHLVQDCASELGSTGCEQTGRGEGLGAEGGESAQMLPRPTSDAAQYGCIAADTVLWDGHLACLLHEYTRYFLSCNKLFE